MSRSKAALTYCEIKTKGDVRTLASHLVGVEDALLDFAIGTEVADRYVIRYELGKGGMGCVFLAHDQTLKRDVALKVQLREFPAEEELDAVREARLAAKLHDGIATVFDHGVHAGKPFTIFEYVPGDDLRTVMATDSVWSVESVCRILEPLADALDSAHARGVIHRDLKPENICLTPSRTPKILDFGIAKDLKTDSANATFRGTPAYASPEQAGCRPADARSDQYALGLIVFELLAGHRPFDEDDPLMLLHMHEFQAPPDLISVGVDVSPAVSEVVMKVLEKQPEKRFATCREFSSALIDASKGVGNKEELLATSDVHISETSSESLVARQLANGLETRGFSSWYYQRDALPGIPLARQVHDSLHASHAALLLISRASLASGDFAEEVLAAHRLRRPCLPVLVDISLEEFQSHQPVWRSALGNAAVIELRHDDISKTLARMESALQQLGITASRSRGQERPKKPTANAQIWATDANQIEINELDRIVFRNEVIDEFLNRKNKYFISATKGLGKTLLLTFKRQLLTQRTEVEESISCVPKGRPYLDFMSEMKSLSARYEKPLSDLSTCKRIWGAALRISILSHHESLLTEDLYFELEPFPQRVQRWLKGSNVEPTVVFKELTNLAIGDVNRLIDDTENFLDEQIRRVNGSTLVFIDKVDQAVRRMGRDAWINIQAGLIEAAWDMMSANSHIKVYASIRQEAFANYESDIKSNLLGATTGLRYSDKDLGKLVDQLSGCYEGVTDFKDFVGVNVIKHARRPFPEDSFGFLRRHTLGRPRDFVAIASELSANRSSLDERKYCDIIRKISAMGLVANVFDEMQVFLDCLQKKTTRLDFLAQLPANIITREAAVSQSARFNGLPEDSLWHFDEDSPDIFHPFRDLFLTGLLGVVQRDEEDRETQRFRQPEDVLSETMRDLPQSRHYLIHPALSEYVQQHRPSSSYRIVQHVLVGENAAWYSFDDTIYQIESELSKVEDVSLRNSVHLLLAQAKTILLSAQPKNLRIEMDASTAWLSVRDKLLNAGHEDVILWIEELIK